MQLRSKKYVFKVAQTIVHLFYKRRPATSNSTLQEPLTQWNSFTASYSQYTHREGVNNYHQPEQYQLAKW